ncbi:MAG: PAS domain S-box protein, partial [Pirellulaceae bacterium]|nr:PAS domain S-box protein [Pirellulaceae bacterium]
PPGANTGANTGANIDESTKSSVEGIDSTSLVQLLEYELKSTREELQNTIEEMESANEELQSSNEELESSKEELQSLNEELSTVNCQLLEKVGELDESNYEITNLMTSTEIATLYLDDHLRIKRFTHPTIALFSLVPSDKGRDIRGFASQIVDNKLLEECQYVLQKQELVETEIFTSDNRCFLRRILPFRKADHETEGVVVTYVDLTAIKRAEAQQRERDACFRQIFEHAATGIAIGSLDGLFETCNPAYCELLGYSEAELRHTHLLSLVHPDDQARNREALRTLKAGEVFQFEIESRYLHKNGSVVWVRKIGSVLPDGSGKASNLLILVTNVSVQHQALEALRQSEERNLAILKTASDAIITISNQGLIDSVNQSTEAMFGYSSSELIGQNVSLLMPLPFSKEHDGYIQRFLTTNEPHIIGTGREVVCRRKDGSVFPADLAVNQVDHLGLFTGVLRDISSRKEMQKHILEIAENEQRRIGLELHDGTQQELTGLSLFANALLESIENAIPSDAGGEPGWAFKTSSYERLKGTAGLLSKRLAETNQHVRDLAHGIVPVQIDSEGLRSALVELANSVNSDAKINCTFECEGDFSIPNNSTATHLYRIAQEAINNALRHGSADRIRISLSLQGDEIALEISDNGVGFNSQTQSSVGMPAKGMGMRTMEYRASLIGGRVHIQQGLEGGTLVRCEISKRGDSL